MLKVTQEEVLRESRMGLRVQWFLPVCPFPVKMYIWNPVWCRSHDVSKLGKGRPTCCPRALLLALGLWVGEEGAVAAVPLCPAVLSGLDVQPQRVGIGVRAVDPGGVAGSGWAGKEER